MNINRDIQETSEEELRLLRGYPRWSFRNWQFYESISLMFSWILSLEFLCLLDTLPLCHSFLRVFLSFTCVYMRVCFYFVLNFQEYFLFFHVLLCLSGTINCSYFFMYPSSNSSGDPITHLTSFRCWLTYR